MVNKEERDTLHWYYNMPDDLWDLTVESLESRAYDISVPSWNKELIAETATKIRER
jgi:hypothetical protein